MKKKFLGQCVGVQLYERGENDPHICLRLLVEDDGEWFDKDFSISSSWLDELTDLLEMAKTYVEKQTPDISPYDGKQYGWRFKVKGDK